MVQLTLRVDPNSDVPVYRQLVEQVALAVAAGSLEVGDPLPSVRTLAADLRVNPNTSARALREMSLVGLARAVRGSGYEVAGTARHVANRIAREILEREVGRVVCVAVDLGLDRDALEQALDEEWKEATDAHRGRGPVEGVRA